jgi:peptidoglycan/LPS O-acetylase OafA/YrhL
MTPGFSLFMANMTVADVIQRENNNLDLARLLLAAMVVYGHSFSLTPGVGGGTDIFYSLFGIYAGDLAIKSFFFISGLLVGRSLITNRSPLHYVLNRFFRIWPGLVVVIVVMALVTGPLLSTLPFFKYLARPEPYSYVWRQIGLQVFGGQSLGYFDLPGVFETNIYPKNVNAPLWSIGVEVYCYLFLLALFLITGLKPWVAALVFTAIFVDSFLPQKVIFSWLPQNSTDFSMLPLCFATGTLAAVFATRTKMYMLLGLALLDWLLLRSLPFPVAGYLIFFVVLLWLFSTPLAKRLRPPHDISYGLYLWG